MRPRTLDEVVGQDEVIGRDRPLRRILDARDVTSGESRPLPPSMIFWGPPGTGKTTLARLVANAADLPFVTFSAVTSGIKEVRESIAQARERRRHDGRPALLFVDEIHRFNRAQQDAFLPHVEDGTIVLVGATTENPSFELNAALLSRCQVLVLRRLDERALETLLERAEAATGRALPLDAEARAALVAMADGDGRYILTLAEEL